MPGEKPDLSMSDGVSPPQSYPVAKRSLTTRIIRYTLATLVLIALLGLSGLGLGYFVWQGSGLDNQTATARLKSSLEQALGENFEAVIGTSELEVAGFRGFELIADHIEIVRKSDGVTVSSLSAVEIEGSISEILSGNTGLEEITIGRVVLDAEVMAGAQGIVLPKHLKQPLEHSGVALAGLQKSFELGNLESIDIREIFISGPVLGRNQTDPITIKDLQFRPTGKQSFSVEASGTTTLSSFGMSASYNRNPTGDGTSDFSFQLSGLHLQEWFEKPEVSGGYIGADSLATFSGALFFNAANRPLDPKLNISVDRGGLRIGYSPVTELEAFDLNLRILLDRNQIELDPTYLFAGGLEATFIGGILPAEDAAGYHGPLRYDLIMKTGKFKPTLENEPVESAAFKLAGVYSPGKKHLTMDRVVMTTVNGAIEGSGELGLTDVSPSIKASAKTNGISAIALKQFWPFFIADGARKWVHSHVIDGWVNSGTLEADIPAGVIFNLWSGSTVKPDEFKVSIDMQDVKFRPFGDLPPIEDATGKVNLEGLTLTAELEKGIVKDLDGEAVNARNGRFFMADYVAIERNGEANIELRGNIQSIAEISQRAPLRVMERLKVEPEQFTGAGYADVAARFPIGRKTKYSEVDWNVLLEMKDAASSRKLAGRSLSEAELLVDANPAGAKVTGTMAIDGIPARVNFVEPIGKSGKTKRYRKIVTTIDDEGREALGINLEPVVSGPVAVTIEQRDKKESYKLDFLDATIDLPWVGWSKGAGIAAKGEFDLKRVKGGRQLDNFMISGVGFEAEGSMKMDKTGLLSADLIRVKLNEGDDIQFKLRRDDDGFNINASGLYFDARGVLNALIHQGGFTSAQGERSVNLVANFATVKGFGNREIQNTVLLYESRRGRLNRLDMRGEGNGAQRYNVQAQLNGNDTLFTIKTNDAGGALAFTNIYTRMEGGQMEANLVQGETGPYVGPVRLRNFAVVNEPRLQRMASSVNKQVVEDRDSRRSVIPDGADRRVQFLLADAEIERGQGYFNVADAIVRSQTMGIAMDGVVYDANDRMDLTGTFMPANGLNLAVSVIPLIGPLLSNGKDQALIGITYRLRGSRKNPELQLNPISAVTPGIFNRVFEFDP